MKQSILRARPLLMLLGLCAISSTAGSTICFMPTRMCNKLQSSDIFIGRVIQAAATKFSGGDKVNVIVERSFKGTQNHIVTITSYDDSDYHFSINERYLIYADRLGVNDSLRAGECSGTMRLADAQADLAIFDKLSNLPREAIIYGRLTSGASANEVEAASPKTMAVVVTHDRDSYRAIPDNSGYYEISGLAPGTYLVNLTIANRPKQVKIVHLAKYGCVQVDFATPGSAQ